MAISTGRHRRTRIVGIGGGTGLSVLLRGLKAQAERSRNGGRGIEISAIVSVADDGGSTGRLRRSFDIPALGDLRACLVAASQDDSVWQQLFQHRFTSGNELEGHALGNLMFAALLERSGGLSDALEQLAEPMRLCARVLPVTEERVTLCAKLDDGSVVHGESEIPSRGRRIDRLWLSPERPAPARGVLQAIAEADAIVLGPGSLFTSVIVNLLVDGVAEAVRNSRALRIFACNLWTQGGETDALDAAGHLRALESYLGKGAVDVCLVNGCPPPEGAVQAGGGLARGAAVLLPHAATDIVGEAIPMVADLAAKGMPHRHDPDKLAELVVSLARTLRRRRPAPKPMPWVTPPALVSGVRQLTAGAK